MHELYNAQYQSSFLHSVLGATDSESVLDSVAGATESEATLDSVRGASESGIRLGPRLPDDVITRCIQAQQSGICHPVSLFNL